MKIHHLRNATFVIESGKHFILIDPMLCDKGKLPLEEIIKFIRLSPNKVIANHLEALNHCPTTRSQLRQVLENNDLLSKTFIPDDGKTLTID
ncbi:MAG: hypothetical protein MUE70_04035 [Desulfobacterales bacterium]|jgi:hypothetical protein|nr:hypothetical protein [Desulfobacterales bacterium]